MESGVDNFAQVTSEYLAWLRKIGVTMNPKMALADLRSEGRGRGVVALDDIDEDEIIFSIPKKAVLNMQNVTIDASHDLNEEKLTQMPQWLSLTIYIMLEMRKPHSPWAPYFAVLPTESHALILWSEDDLADLGYHHIRERIGKEDMEKLFHEHVQTLGVPGLTVDLFHKTASTIMAYAFDVLDLESEEDSDVENGEELVPDVARPTILSMVPLADMLNADADRNNACLDCDNEGLEMRAIKGIKKGEEIFNDYGPLPRAELLRRYGYFTDRYTQYDVAEIPTEYIRDLFVEKSRESLLFEGLGLTATTLPTKDLEARLELAKREDVYEDSYELSRATEEGHCIPDELIMLIWLLLLNEDSLRAFESSSCPYPNRKRMCTKVVGVLLQRMLEDRESGAPNPFEVDEEILARDDAYLHKMFSHRHLLAIKLRYGDLQILRMAQLEASQFQGNNNEMRVDDGKRVADGDAEGEAPSKRSKY